MKRKLKCWFGLHSPDQHRMRQNVVIRGRLIPIPPCRHCARLVNESAFYDFSETVVPKIILSALVLLWASIIIHFIWFTP